MEKEKKILVLGAGMGGLISACLMAKDNQSVEIIESHTASGGCAGYFHRREGVYDAGATTISGMEDFKPFYQVLKDLNIEIPLDLSKVPLKIYLESGKVFNYYRDRDLLLNEIRNIFNINLNDFILKIENIEKKLWACLNIFYTFPKIRIGQILKFIFSKNISLIFNLNIFYKSFYNFLPKHVRANKDFISLIDQILLISCQQTSKTTPAFIGILGFLYPRDSYSIRGGMKTLCNKFEKYLNEKNVFIKYKTNCIRVDQDKVITNNEEIKYDILISNINPSFLKSSIKKDINQDWSALVAYLYLDENKIKNSFIQVHLNKYEKSIFNTDSIFISSSNENDTYRSKSNKQLITISTHISKDATDNLDDVQYIEYKDKYKLVIELIMKRVCQLSSDQLNFDSISTPRSFQRFTKRPQGEVGGVAIKSLLQLFSIQSNLVSSNKYQVGDYAFPGQGIVAISQGCLNVRKIIREKESVKLK